VVSLEGDNLLVFNYQICNCIICKESQLGTIKDLDSRKDTNLIVDKAKYLGVTISEDLKWEGHINYICGKANRILGFLRRNPNIGDGKHVTFIWVENHLPNMFPLW
jgi:hypothetical protein